MTNEVSRPAGESFSEFYDREFGVSVRRAALLVGTSEVAHDVVQDAFIEVYRRWGTLDNPGGYLHRSVVNGCRDVARRRTSNVRLLHRLSRQQPIDGPGDVLDDVLARLTFNQRAAVVLRYYGGLTTNEIALLLDCRPGSVGPWIDRALDAMRKALQ